jgi:hypothetical protein
MIPSLAIKMQENHACMIHTMPRSTQKTATSLSSNPDGS